MPPSRSIPSLWEQHAPAVARFQHAADSYHAWRAAQPPRTQWSAHTKLAAAGMHQAFQDAAAEATATLMHGARGALFGAGLSFKTPALSHTNAHLAWYSAPHSSKLLLQGPNSIAFVWGMMLGMEECLTNPNHPIREEWRAFDMGAPRTTFELVVNTPHSGCRGMTVSAPDPVAATAGIRAAVEGFTEGAETAELAFHHGFSYGHARGMMPFAWTALPSWWKAAFSSEAGKKLHPAKMNPSLAHIPFAPVAEAMKALGTVHPGMSRVQWGVQERIYWPDYKDALLRLAATLAPLNAALCHCARLAQASGTPPKGPMAAWIVQDASGAVRPVKAWSGASAFLAHALATLGHANRPNIPTSMRLWKAWPMAAEDGAAARALAP